MLYGYPFPRRPRGRGPQTPPQAPGGRHPGRPGAASQVENRAALRERHDFAHGPLFRGRAPSTAPQTPAALRAAGPQAASPRPTARPRPRRPTVAVSHLPPWRPPRPRPAEAQDGDGHFRAEAQRGRSPGRLRKVVTVAWQRAGRRGCPQGPAPRPTGTRFAATR